MLESLNYSFRNPRNIIWVIYRIKHEKLQKNHGVLRGPQLGKQRWRARLGILRVNTYPFTQSAHAGLHTLLSKHLLIPCVLLRCLNYLPLRVKRPEREGNHYTASNSKFKEASNCIPTAHYGFVTSWLIISVTLTQNSFNTEGFKMSVIFACMTHIIGRGVSCLCVQSLILIDKRVEAGYYYYYYYFIYSPHT